MLLVVLSRFFRYAPPPSVEITSPLGRCMCVVLMIAERAELSSSTAEVHRHYSVFVIHIDAIISSSKGERERVSTLWVSVVGGENPVGGRNKCHCCAKKICV